MIKKVQAPALKCTCELCKYSWLTLATNPPGICPKCRSREWNGKKRTGRPPSGELLATMPRPKKLREVTL
jgi:hypothetical protein